MIPEKLMGQRPFRRVYLQEVVLRDGFQNEAAFIPTEDKIALADKLSASGIAKLEVTSFTSPKAIPNLRDAEDVMRGLRRMLGVTYTALVPNLRGAERAIDVSVDELNLVLSVSETHNRANLRMTREQSFLQLKEVARLAHAAETPFTASLSCAFGCPMEGEMDSSEVLTWARRFIDLGAIGINYCDTTGMAFPTQVLAFAFNHQRLFPQTEISLHFHDTRGLGLANALAGLVAGVNRFDAALGGIGGCPYAPGATGNLCTEDLVHLLDLEQIYSGVDLRQLIQASHDLRRLVGHDTPGQIAKAGCRNDLHPPPAAQTKREEENRGSRVFPGAEDPVIQKTESASR